MGRWMGRKAQTEGYQPPRQSATLTPMAEQFTKHRQPWKPDEVAKLRVLASKGKGLKEIAKALSRSEESTKERAKIDGIGIAKLR